MWEAGRVAEYCRKGQGDLQHWSAMSWGGALETEDWRRDRSRPRTMRRASDHGRSDWWASWHTGELARVEPRLCLATFSRTSSAYHTY